VNFWSVIKWGGTAIFILIVSFIGFAADGGGSDSQSQVNQPTKPVQSGSKFNF
jgi:hypothetical protein